MVVLYWTNILPVMYENGVARILVTPLNVMH